MRGLLPNLTTHTPPIAKTPIALLSLLLPGSHFSFPIIGIIPSFASHHSLPGSSSRSSILPRGQRAFKAHRIGQGQHPAPAFAVNDKALMLVMQTSPWQTVVQCSVVAQIQTRLRIPAHTSSQLVTFHRSTFCAHPRRTSPPSQATQKPLAFHHFVPFVAHLLFPAPFSLPIFTLSNSRACRG